MRTYLQALVTLTLLVVCLMFAPARRVTGDRELAGRPSLDPPPAMTSVKSFADLCRDDPVEAVAASMRKYKAEVEGYTCVLRLRERVDGKLRDAETVECEFRESPFAVRMHWIGTTEGAESLLYAAGENQENFLVVPANPTLKKTLKLLGRKFARRRLDGSEAKSASRYAPNEFGVYCGTERVYGAWRAAKERGELRTEYLGLQPVPELDGKLCHAIRRNCLTPEEDGLTQVTIQFDPESLLQVGAVLMTGDDLIGRYHFVNLKLNPRLAVDRFLAEALK
jgi:Protein of unknown function (DUF1571)